jgi:ssRNA-specific RNase YbeY (16S rRNA maturation enzyme)
MTREADEDGMVRLGDIVICSQKLKAEVELTKKEIKVIMAEWMDHGVENLLI